MAHSVVSAGNFLTIQRLCTTKNLKQARTSCRNRMSRNSAYLHTYTHKLHSWSKNRSQMQRLLHNNNIQTV